MNAPSRFFQTATLRLHALEAGDGEPVVMLHGFPDLSLTWRFQFPALTRAGYRVIAPDLRGYGKTDRPQGIENYRSEKLVEDILGLFDAAGLEKATLVGHDWGAVVAWHFAMRHPDRLNRLAILNGPHPVQYARMLRNPQQIVRSWYAAAFLIPRLPERVLGARHAATVVALLERMAPGAFTDEDRAAYREAFSQPGALTAMLNYYRAAAFKDRLGRRATHRVDVPTQIIWGEEDPALHPSLADVPADLASNTRIHRIGGVGHFCHLQAPNDVNRKLLEFLKA